jgi:hypothetical protein
MGSKATPNINFFWQNSTKFVLKIRLSIRVRNFEPPNEPLNVEEIIYISSPKSPTHRDFMV